MINLVTLFQQQFKREVLVQVRQLRSLINTSLFFLMIMFFFPLTLPPAPALLHTIIPGISWIAMLLAMLLSAERIFQQDVDDGVVEQWLVSGQPLAFIVAIKIIAHWILTVLPMLLLSPIIALLFALNLHQTLTIMLSLACGSPAILFLCALAAAFGISLQQKSVLIGLILLPLTIPVMIFGSGAITAALHGLPIKGHLALMSAISLISIGLLPSAIAGVIGITTTDSMSVS
ncbi:MAG: heme exporter protein CcmB [Legionella sp.]